MPLLKSSALSCRMIDNNKKLGKMAPSTKANCHGGFHIAILIFIKYIAAIKAMDAADNWFYCIQMRRKINQVRTNPFVEWRLKLQQAKE